MGIDCNVEPCAKNKNGRCSDENILACYLRSRHPVKVDKEDEHLFTGKEEYKGRCPSCSSKNIDGLGVDPETNDTSYGCRECNIWFIIKGEPYTFEEV